MSALFRISDERIVARVLAGDREAFGVLVRRYLPAVQAVAYSRAGIASDADDVAQEAFIKAFQRLDTLRSGAKFAPWLLTIARNTSYTWAVKRRREAEVLADAPEPEAVNPEIERRELRASVRRHVMQLDDGPREILLLRYFTGMSLREIATVLGITPNAAKKRLQRAREQLGANLLAEIEQPQPADARDKEVTKVMGAVGAVPVAWEKTGVSGGLAAAIAGLFGGLVAARYVAMMLIGIVALLGVVGGAVVWSPLFLGAPQRGAESEVADAAGSDFGSPTDSENDAAGGDEALLDTDEAGPSTLIHGTTMDSRGAAIANAAVFLRIDDASGRRAASQARSDSAGRFSLRAPGEQPATVYAAAGNKRSRAHRIDTTQETVEPITLILFEQGAIRGLVTNAREGNFGKLQVLAVSETDRESTTTDASGNFKFSALFPGEYIMLVQPAGSMEGANLHATTTVLLDEGVVQDNVVLPVSYGPGVEGVVTDTDGLPLPNVVVRTGSCGIARVGQRLVETYYAATTDEDGRYRLPYLPDDDAARYEVSALHESYVDGEASGVAAGASLNFQLSKRPRVAGRVVDADTGAPVTAYRILPWETHDRPEPERAAVQAAIRSRPLEAHPEGRFEFTAEQTGRLSVYAVADGYGIGSALVDDAPAGSEIQDVTIELKKTPPVAVTVVGPSGQPVAGARVHVGMPVIDGMRTHAGVTDSNGECDLVLTRGEDEWVSARHEEYAPGWIEVGEEDTDLRIALLEGGTIYGRATIDGRAVRAGEVQVVPLLPGFHERPLLAGSHTTDEHGNYRIEGVTSGAIRVQARLAGSAASRLATEYFLEQELPVEDGHVSDKDWNFETGGDAAIEGVVLVNGEAPRRCRITARREREDGTFDVFRTHTNKEGRYRLESVLPGSFELEAVATAPDGLVLAPRQLQLDVGEGATVVQDFFFR